MNDIDDIFTVKEAAHFLGMSTTSLNRWRSKGGGPNYRKLGRAVRYLKSDLLDWMDGNVRDRTTSNVPQIENPTDAAPIPTKLNLAQAQSEIWQHIMSGGLYRLETDTALIEDGVTQAAIYRSLWDGQVWVRPVAEFFDGRFRNLAVDEITDCRPLADRPAEAQAHMALAVSWLARNQESIKPECLAGALAEEFLT